MEEQRHREDIIKMERDRDRERDTADRANPNRDPYPPNAPPHHSTAGSIPIHQPVANRFTGTVHSPGGLLSNHGTSSNNPLGAPSGPVPPSGPLGPPGHEPNRQPPHAAQNGNAPAPSQHAMFGQGPHGPMPPNGSVSAPNGANAVFGPPLQLDANARGPAQPMAFGGGVVGAGGPIGPAPGNMNQGQQPILNVRQHRSPDRASREVLGRQPRGFDHADAIAPQDALSYLDQVKVQFSEQPDVYNRFLDIMKDFKSQTIDTPGVIARVSELFAGHPNLIQGFNTFLPPGYRIECGLENNPNAIRVTTPSGSTIHSIGAPGRVPIDLPPAQPAANPRFVEQQQQQRPPNFQGTLHHSIESPEGQFSTPAQGHSALAQGSGQSAPFSSHSPNQLRGGLPPPANSAAAHAPVPRNAHTPTPTAAQLLNGAAAQQANMDAKRGPVEFNHAISYVNKIKNRFQDKPEIYKQFLEILQTYQREQKPIQDVYAQVTTLFNAAPDLLEDFKQFLPESAAQTRGGGQRPEDVLSMAQLAQTPQPGQAARDGPKGPPVGNFAPPASATKENKKRRADKQIAAPPPMGEIQQSNVRGGPSAANKRIKTGHAKAGPNDGLAIEPTLTPVMPEPLAPTPQHVLASDEILFFDKVKKFLNNRNSNVEFLKLCNLYTQDLIDKNVLMHRAHEFIGSHPDLFNWFKNFIYWNGEDQTVENRPAPPSGRVSLSNCRGYGPSYRLLPKRERLKKCTGRDALCASVLNDEWASHPTWASEDSGFVAHRKNAFEEGLHRIEEERHDYDFFIEACQKCIQLLEPIAQQMLTLPPQERVNFTMPPGLGGHSQSIYKRVLKKVYGNEHGPKVVNDMFSRPFSVVPVVLARLKQKDEEWRFSQREWERIWQTQTEILFLKSLDHMGLSVKSNDKRNLSAKHLIDLIKTRHEEQKRSKAASGPVTRFQFLWDFKDKDVILDLLRFMCLYATNSGQHGQTEKERILDFFEMFIPQFFELPEDKVQEKLVGIERDSSDEGGDDAAPAELSNGRSGGRKKARSDLLRAALDPGRNNSKSRNQKEGSNASGSKETTPDVMSGNEEEMPDAPDEGSGSISSDDQWLSTANILPTVTTGPNALDSHGELRHDGLFRRPWYNFFCNQTLYVFFSILHTLYSRLKEVKENVDSVKYEIEREKMNKPAKELKLINDEPKWFKGCTEDEYWGRTVELIEKFIDQEDMDENTYQDILRRYYLKNGWKLYTIQDLLKTLCRLALVCNNTDSKEKTSELYTHYFKNRQNEETSFQVEIKSRKFAEKCIKDGEMFLIRWFPDKDEATVRWMQKDDTTFHLDEMGVRDRWQYYISSWSRNEPTEGVPRTRMQKPMLTRNFPPGEVDSDNEPRPKTISYRDDLSMSVCLNTSKIVYNKGSRATVFRLPKDDSEARTKSEKESELVLESRNQKYVEKMAMNSSWMKNLSQEAVQQAKEDYGKWKSEGNPPPQPIEDDWTMIEAPDQVA